MRRGGWMWRRQWLDATTSVVAGARTKAVVVAAGVGKGGGGCRCRKERSPPVSRGSWRRAGERRERGWRWTPLDGGWGESPQGWGLWGEIWVST